MFVLNIEAPALSGPFFVLILLCFFCDPGISLDRFWAGLSLCGPLFFLHFFITKLALFIHVFWAKAAVN